MERAGDRTGCGEIGRTRGPPIPVDYRVTGPVPRRQIGPAGKLKSSLRRGFRQCGPQDSNLQPRDSRALAFPRGLDYLILLGEAAVTPGPGGQARGEDEAAPEEAGRSRRGLLLGLTPLVSEPSWPPTPSQAWLRIAVPSPVRPGP